jgi:hypothetical protein
MHPALAQLDVAVLNFLIFEKILVLDAKVQDDPQTCKYTSKIPEALAALSRGDARLAFFLNPTRIEQVQEVAAGGLIMPRKSTFFYPKVPTGMILNPINPQEEIVLPDPSAKQSRRPRRFPNRFPLCRPDFPRPLVAPAAFTLQTQSCPQPNRNLVISLQYRQIRTFADSGKKYAN